MRGHTITIESPTRLLPAGWYTDPGQTGGKRWWDGTKWTEHLKAPEVPKAAATATNKPNPYGLNVSNFVPIDPATVIEDLPAPKVDNRAARLSILFGIAALALTLLTTLPGSPMLWICAAATVAVLCGALGFVHLAQRRASNGWAPVIGIIFGLGATAIAILGISTVAIVNSMAPGLIPTISTTTTRLSAPQTSSEPFVFASNPGLTNDGTTLQQIATALNRTYAGGNSTLTAGQSWPTSLKFTDTQILSDSGTPLVTVASGLTFKYELSADKKSYSFSVSSGARTESAVYFSSADKFSFRCPAGDTTCVPVH